MTVELKGLTRPVGRAAVGLDDEPGLAPEKVHAEGDVAACIRLRGRAQAFAAAPTKTPRATAGDSDEFTT